MNDPKVFSDSYDMTLKIFNYTKSIPKSFRPTLGRRLEEDALKITHAIRVALLNSKKISARSENNRLNHLRTASDSLDEIRVNLKICHDLKIISIPFYKEIVESTREVGRELGGLIKASSSFREEV